MKTRSIVLANCGFMIFLAHTAVASAAEIKVLSTGALRSVINELAPRFEGSAGHKLVISFAGPDAMKRQIDSGETFDVAIAIPAVIDNLVQAGKIDPRTRTSLARSGVGVAVRAGTPKPDISSVDALKRTLLNAKSVAYSVDGPSGRHFLSLLARFGIAEDMKPRLKALTTAPAIAVVAKGEADLAVLLISPIVSASGVELAGPLPSEVQLYVDFALGISSHAKEREAADALIRFLRAPEAVQVIKANGMEPGASQ
jgi:molybdate transport system substrate-binding protein